MLLASFLLQLNMLYVAHLSILLQLPTSTFVEFMLLVSVELISPLAVVELILNYLGV